MIESWCGLESSRVKINFRRTIELEVEETLSATILISVRF